MRKFFIFFLLIQFTLLYANELDIIPKPASINNLPGKFQFNNKTTLVYTKNTKQLANYFARQYEVFKNHELEQNKARFIFKQNKNVIVFQIDENLDLPREGYYFKISPSKILVKGKSEKGLFYGIQSLVQLVHQNKKTIPAVEIKDFPRYKYRGVHLDVGRHFFSPTFIKKYIDMLALHKINTFHWHLTEDQGWRIEIKKYPKLTEVGAYRSETVVGHAGQSDKYDGKRYGGFYTQEEVKEIVAYAQKRHVKIIPEIELPGHSRAALAAYPELGCTGGPYTVSRTWGVRKDIYCAGKEKTFEFLEDVLTEVMELFPSEYIHIGGDEAPKDRWKICDRCQKRIKAENLKDEHELQSYFITRIEKFLNDNGRRIIGWDEILEGGLAPNATVMSWRGIKGGLAAARSEHDVIMTPVSHCYFDYYQAMPEFEPLAIGGYLTVKKVYSFDPVPPTLQPEYRKYVIGGQANVWTEYMKTSDHVEYMLNPRLAAMAEALWTPKTKKDWEGFQKRLQSHFKLLAKKDINYSRGTYKVDIKVKVDKKAGKAKVSLESEQYNPVIRYTLDGSDPTNQSPQYDAPFVVNSVTTVKAAIFKSGQLYRGISEKKVGIHKALGADVTLENKFHFKYSADGVESLVDGLAGSDNFNDGYWQGYEGKDFIAVLDLGKVKKFSSLRMNFIEAYGSWIFSPDAVQVSISEDGKQYQPISRLENPYEIDRDGARKRLFNLNFDTTQSRYIKINAKSIGQCPPGHPGEGKKAWLFIDEIFVE